MFHHYITKYTNTETGKRYAVSWLQLNIGKFCWCFSIREKEIGGRKPKELLFRFPLVSKLRDWR